MLGGHRTPAALAQQAMNIEAELFRQIDDSTQSILSGP
jgi:hypothetical protein